MTLELKPVGVLITRSAADGVTISDEGAALGRTLVESITDTGLTSPPEEKGHYIRMWRKDGERKLSALAYCGAAKPTTDVLRGAVSTVLRETDADWRVMLPEADDFRPPGEV